MKRFQFNSFYFIRLTIFLTFLAQTVLAQKTGSSRNEPEESYTWWYVTLIGLFLCLINVLIWWYKDKEKTKGKVAVEPSYRKSSTTIDSGPVDADREMEWLRKNQNLVDKKRKRALAKKKMEKNLPKNEETIATSISYQEKPEEIDPTALPVFKFERIAPAKSFSPLPLSNDEALLSAIEQAYDEDEEDEEVRDLAVRILSAFKNRNSIEALSQVALYDLSSNLRSKAILTLTEFDHESVFETILLACADPTREVRASAARGLTRLSFNRADAWARIYEMNEPGRIKQAARAAIESGFVQRAFDRLVHPDKHQAYEAFALIAMLIKAGELEPVMDTLKSSTDINVKKAILHLIKVTEGQNALNELYKLLDDRTITTELRKEVDKVLEQIALVAV